ncbi:MAG: heavy-metal-associated domain-containing protein [Fimbriimonadales bacterium]
MKTITLKSADIHCDACANSIRNTVGKLVGVEHLAVDVVAQCVTVHYDSPVTEEQIKATMADAGFDVIEDTQ